MSGKFDIFAYESIYKEMCKPIFFCYLIYEKTCPINMVYHRTWRQSYVCWKVWTFELEYIPYWKLTDMTKNNAADFRIPIEMYY